MLISVVWWGRLLRFFWWLGVRLDMRNFDLGFGFDGCFLY